MLSINQIYPILRVHAMALRVIDASEPSEPNPNWAVVITPWKKLHLYGAYALNSPWNSTTLTAMPSIHAMQSDGGDDLERASNVPQDDSHPRTPRISQDQEPSVHAIQSDNDDTPSTTSDDSADEGHSSPFHVSQDNNPESAARGTSSAPATKVEAQGQWACTAGICRQGYVFPPHLSDLRISF